MIPELSSDEWQEVAEESLHLILLPGLDGSGRLFVPFLDRLPISFRPHVISYPTDRSYDYDDLVELVRDRLPARGRFVLLGESFSGPIAVRIAAEEPDRTAGLILVASFVTNPLPKFFRWFSRILIRPWIFSFNPPAFPIRWLLLNGTPPAALVELARDAIGMVGDYPMALRVREVVSVDVRKELSYCEAPILYLVAAHDRVVPKRSAREIAAIAQRTTFEVVNAPHLILQYAPDESVDLIVKFMMGIA